MRASLPALAALMILAALCSFAVPAPAGDFDAGQRVKVLLRVLSYDRNLSGRATAGKIGVAILFAPGTPASVAEKNELKAAFAAVRGMKVSGLDLEVAELPFDSAAGFEAALGKARTGAVYVCSGLEGSVAGIAKATRSAKVASLSASEALARAGIAVAVVDEGDRGRIVVNLPAAKAEGMDLDAALLRLADVLK